MTVASCLFLAALVSDALAAIKTTDVDVPASLRGTCLVLCVCISAPPIVNHRFLIWGWAQRPLLYTLLLLAALLGRHHGGIETRACDALFIILTTGASILLVASGGVDTQALAQLGKEHGSPSTMLAAGLLLLCNARILRAGLAHSHEVRNFHIEPSDAFNASFTTHGYAYASEVATLSSCFGGMVGIGTATVVAMHADELGGVGGTGCVAVQAAVSAAFQLLSSVVVYGAFDEQRLNLGIVFDEASCTATGDACDAAQASRRLALVNAPGANLFLSALGLLALAYGGVRQQRLPLLSGVVALALVAAAASMASVFLQSPDTGSTYSEVATLVAVSFSLILNDHWTGSLLYIIAATWEAATSDVHVGPDVLLLGSLALLILHFAMLTLYIFTRAHEQLVGAVAVAGASLGLGLALCTLSLDVSYNGGYDLGSLGADRRLRCLFPVLLWLPLRFCRPEPQLLCEKTRQRVWVGTGVAAGAAYCVAALATGGWGPWLGLVDSLSLDLASVAVGLTPWSSVGLL